jgi:hypothetical protein
MGWYHNKTSPKAAKGLFPKILVGDVRTLPIVLPPADSTIGQLVEELMQVMGALEVASSRFERLVRAEFEITKWPAVLKEWWKLDIGDFIAAVSKRKLDLTIKDQLLVVFDKYRADCSSLEADVQRLDGAIDRAVYRLYGLDHSEIAMVEAF